MLRSTSFKTGTTQSHLGTFNPLSLNLSADRTDADTPSREPRNYADNGGPQVRTDSL